MYAEKDRRFTDRVRTWIIEIRPLFLLGSVLLAFLGTAIAWSEGYFSLRYAILGFIGLVMWHISVQVLNDYHDYRSGIDLKTQRTPFSGGSGVLPDQFLEPMSVLRFGLAVFMLAIPIWIYLIVDRGILLLPVVGVGAICLLLYTPVLSRYKIAEVASALGLGVLPILMFFFVQTGTYNLVAVVGAMAAGILMFNIHLSNEFPDVEADSIGGRKTLPIILGKRKAGHVYVSLAIGYYMWVIAWVTVGTMPSMALLSLISIPVVLFTIRRIFTGNGRVSYTPVLWSGAIVFCLSLILLATGYLVAN